MNIHPLKLITVKLFAKVSNLVQGICISQHHARAGRTQHDATKSRIGLFLMAKSSAFTR